MKATKKVVSFSGENKLMTKKWPVFPVKIGFAVTGEGPHIFF